MEYQNLIKAIDVIAKLRDPENGCPWDLKQDHQSLLKYLIEESYEYIHAVEDKESKKMEEELGDVLLQVLLHSQIASETGSFNIDSVAKALAEKMIHRHPHVFKDKNTAIDAEQVRENWEALKKKERKDEFHIRVDDAYAPSLKAAEFIGAKSQEINFDWDHIDDVLAKVEEELQEVKDEMKTMESKKRLSEEIGDLLFSVAQLSRHLDIDPEEALKRANLKFVKRVNLVEGKVRADGHQMVDLPTNKLEEYWAKVKVELKSEQKD
ncbi:MAG: MazG family protein [Bacteriovoracaceae bacterium]|jgi:MazG family protein